MKKVVNRVAFDHTIVWTFEFEHVVGKLVCNANDHARCRWESIECDCETYYGMNVDAIGPYHLYTGWDEENDVETELRHRMRYGGECNVMNFMNEEGPSEAAEHGISFEVARTPVETEWQGDFYLWRPRLRDRFGVTT